MIKIINNPNDDKNRCQVTMGFEDVLHRPFYVEGENGVPVESGDQMHHAIRRLGWRLLMKHAPQLKDQFKWGDVEVIDGKLMITFYRDFPDMSIPPGGKDAS